MLAKRKERRKAKREKEKREKEAREEKKWEEEAREESKKRLNALFDDIISNAAIDYRNKELQDIQRAVKGMMDKLKDRINKRGLFNISRIQPCGSMVEHTSLWKTLDDVLPGEPKNYIEFDFLAVLEMPSNCEMSQGCEGCKLVEKWPWDEDLLHSYDYADIPFYKKKDKCDIICDIIFKREISSGLVSSCKCCFLKATTGAMFSNTLYTYKILSAEPDSECDKCIITTPTGRLQMAISIEADRDCSLVLMWTSKDMSLLAVDEETLQPTHQVKRLPIYIDFIPAVEIQNKETKLNDLEPENVCFIVSKMCSECYLEAKRWRISYCMTEMDFILNNMSDKHRKCYLVLKFLISYTIVINQYHVKTAVLNHSARCSDESEDCLLCVVAILQDLLNALYSGLPAFGRQGNLMCSLNNPSIFSMLVELLSYFESWKTLRQQFIETDWL